MSNQEEVELRAKIEALGLEVTKVPEQAPKQLDEATTTPSRFLFHESMSYYLISFLFS
jgi:hypothetical protein